jgi:hypothetical protein
MDDRNLQENAIFHQQKQLMVRRVSYYSIKEAKHKTPHNTKWKKTTHPKKQKLQQ